MGKLLKYSGKQIATLGETLPTKAAVASYMYLYPVFLCPSLCTPGHLWPLISPWRSMVPADTAPPTVLQLGLILFQGPGMLLAHHTRACASVWEHLHGQREDRCVAEDNIGTPHKHGNQRAPFLSFSVTITQWKTPSPLRWRIPYWLS